MKKRPDVYGEYYDWILEFPCVVGYDCWEGHVGHHLKTVGAGGKDAGNLVPMCPFHHTEVHMSREKFESKYGLDLHGIANSMQVKWDDRSS